MKRVFGLLFFLFFLIESLILYHFVAFKIPKEYILKLSEFIPLKSNLLLTIVPILLYILFFLVWMVPFIESRRSEKRFLVTSFSFFVTATIVLIFHLLFQTSILAPSIPPKSFFDKAVLIIYSLNRPLNLFPIQYIIFTLLSNFILFKLDTKLAFFTLPITLLLIYIFFIIGHITLLSFIVSLIVSLFGFFVFFLFV